MHYVLSEMAILSQTVPLFEHRSITMYKIKRRSKKRLFF